MAEMLDVGVAKLAALPQEQDRLAQWLMQELPDEELRDKRFSEPRFLGGACGRGAAGPGGRPRYRDVS